MEPMTCSQFEYQYQLYTLKRAIGIQFWYCQIADMCVPDHP